MTKRKSPTKKKSNKSPESPNNESNVSPLLEVNEKTITNFIELFKKSIKDGKIMVVLLHLNGCIHCDRIMPTFKMMANSEKRMNNMATIEYNHMAAVNEALHAVGGPALNADAFPTIVTMNDKKAEEISSNPEMIEVALNTGATMTHPNKKEESKLPLDMMEVESLSQGGNRHSGGGLLTALSQTAYTLAPTAVLLATAAAIMKGTRKGRKGKKIRRKTLRKLRTLRNRR